LCAVSERKSTPSCSTSSGSLPAACEASVCSNTPLARQVFAMAAMSQVTPISLFASISDTSSVSGRSAARTASGSTRPVTSGSTSVTAKASFSSCLQVSSTDLCSVRELTMWPRSWLARRAACATPSSARLLASVAPEVKMISRGAAPISAATCARAASTRSNAARPGSWVAEAGFPWSPGLVRHSAMAAATRGSTGVVAA
jgi:hypothetical protein